MLVKIFYSGICGSQLGEIIGTKGKDKYLPHLMGHEATGEVIDVHATVSKVKREMACYYTGCHQMACHQKVQNTIGGVEK